MNFRELGKTGVNISEISLGCWTMGGLNWVNGVPNGWANVDEKEISNAINYAIDMGVNHFDNADVYGNGRAERMLARILGKKTNDMIIATKIGWFPGTAEYVYHPTHIRHQCEQSLINLKRDYIDLYYFHHGDFGENYKYLDAAIEEMYKLKAEGKIRFIGQSAYKHEDFVHIVPKLKPDALQSWAHAMDYKFIADETPTRKLLDEYKMSFIAFSPLAQGLLLDKYNKENPPQFEPGDFRLNSPKFAKDNLGAIEPKVNEIKKHFGSSVEDLARVAQQFLLKFDVVGAVIPGFRNLNQVKVNLAAIDKPLTDDEFNLVKKIFSN